MHIEGVIPPMITPFTKSGEVDYEAHAANVEKWNDTGLRGYLVLGSNSEAVFLSEQEKLRLIEETVEAASVHRLILAGTGMESTRETIHLTNLAAEKGAHLALLLTPAYYAGKMDAAALIRHYERIAEESDIPILLYNVPKYTHLNVPVPVVRELSAHPNIVGMKDSTGNIAQLLQFQAAAADGYQVLVGTASIWYPALTLGCDAAVMALANCAPEACVKVQKLFLEDRREEAEELYRRLVPVNQAVTATYGIAGLKYACSLRGYQGGYVRSPLAELKEEEKKAIRGILEAASLLDG